MAEQASSVRRILKEWRGISERTREARARGEELPWSAHPVQRDQPHEWHFTIRGPAGRAFEMGMYHGKLILPPQYPLQPPSIYFLTMNGRFDVGKPICLTVTQYHPEEWQPAWGIASILDALQAFLPTPGENAAYALDWSDRTRQQLALQSINYRCPTCNRANKDLLARGHPCIDDDDEAGDGAPAGAAEAAPAEAGRSPEQAAEAEESFRNSWLDEYTVWSSISLLEYITCQLLWRRLAASKLLDRDRWWRQRHRILMRTAKGVLAAYCVWQIWCVLSNALRNVWFLHEFPIRRPAQLTTLGDLFPLSRTERTEEFELHPVFKTRG